MKHYAATIELRDGRQVRLRQRTAEDLRRAILATIRLFGKRNIRRGAYTGLSSD